MFSRIILLVLGHFTVSVLSLTADEIEAERSGWSTDPNAQFHIQTDEGDERFFRYQTLNGQYRKERRLADGTVIGTEGWLDELGYLRLKDYIADHNGYRILRSKKLFVGKRPINEALAEAKNVPAQGGELAKPARIPNPFRQPESGYAAPLASNDLDYYPSSVASPYYASSTARPYHASGTSRPYQSSSTVRPYASRVGYSPRTSYVPVRPVAALQAPLVGRNYNRPETIYATGRRSSTVDVPEYDGIHSTKNGFQYFLDRQYHEEQRKPNSENRVGSFGYIDPFGIRRVVYYKTDPITGGFVHSKNNRYVGFRATPYDPLPPNPSSNRASRSTS